MGGRQRRGAGFRVIRAAFILSVLTTVCYSLSRFWPNGSISSGSGANSSSGSHGSISSGRGSSSSAHASRRSLAEYAVDTPVRLYGRVKKTGPLGTLAWVAAGHHRDQLTYPLSWRNARLAGERWQPPAKWCVMYFNELHKLIYLKNTKSAGTTLLTYFSDCTGAVVPPGSRCLKRLEYTNTTMVDNLMASWDDYFVFSFSRNVLQRAISQYHYLSSFMSNGTGCPRISWGEYCTDPYQMGDVCYTKAARRCCRQSAEHQYVHAAPQVDCLTTTTGGSAMDWLGRTEHFEDDFAALVAELNARGGGIPQLPLDVLPVKSNYAKSPCKSSGEGGNSDGSSTRDGSGNSGNGSSGSSDGRGNGSSSGGHVGRLQGGGSADGSGRARDARIETLHLCNKRDYFRGDFAHCFQGITQFYEMDLDLLL